jgi:hypothetical protein
MKALIRLQPTTELHPLHQTVVAIFRRDPYQDVAKLAVELSGCRFLGKRAAGSNKAYRIVAADVLDYMLSQGHLTRDEHGWYLLAEATPRA